MTDTSKAILEAGVFDFENKTFGRVAWRLLPLLFLCYIVAYLDRVNVGFAKLQMLNDLKLSETAYGLGAGIFFIGYFLFEVPSNLLLHRVGARRWIARIMITWGLISVTMMFVSTTTTFYVLRFLLGVAEAGFFPGIVLYLTYWFPSHRRGRMNALYMTAIPLAGVVGGPLSGWILHTLTGVYNLAGWQWMFLLEGLPTTVLGLIVLCCLDDSPKTAKWLSSQEKELIASSLARDQTGKSKHSFKNAFLDGKVWILSLVYFGVVMGLYGISFWLPTLIKATGVKDALNVGLLSAIPYAISAITMVLNARSADFSQEHRWHVALPCILGGIGLIFSTIFAHNTTFALVASTVACCGIMGTLPVFWSLPTAFLGGAAAAGGIALINSLGNLAGFTSPYLVGAIKDATNSIDYGMYALACCMFTSAVLLLVAIPREVFDARVTVTRKLARSQAEAQHKV